jgi:hypothetical protein
MDNDKYHATARRLSKLAEELRQHFDGVAVGGLMIGAGVGVLLATLGDARTASYLRELAGEIESGAGADEPAPQ